MEELTTAFTSGLGFESKPKEPPASASSSSHSSLHKIKGSGLSSQEERRRRNLEIQKEKRKDYLSQIRKIVESDEDDQENMDTSSKKEKRKPKRFMANQLMFSEWLVDVPPDLEENWCMVACPKGKRCLVTTSRGITRAYKKNGYCFKTFHSYLPAGYRRNDGKTCLLDCVFNEEKKTFYVLDVMCWMGHPVYDSDTEFRFFWLQAKFADVQDVGRISDHNPFAFIPLPSYSCSRSTMESVMSRKLPFEAELDGILLYHKQTHYVPGNTPLVGWLKPWMLPGVLGVSVPQSFIDAKPQDEPWEPPVPTEFEMESADQSTDGSIKTEELAA